MQTGRTTPPPLTVILILGTALGLIAGLLIGQGLASQVTYPAPAISIALPTLPPTATPTATAAPTWTPLPTRPALTPTPTPLPWRYCSEADPGEVCIPSRVLTPTATATVPPCSSGQTRYRAGVELCVNDLPAATAEPREGRR